MEHVNYSRPSTDFWGRIAFASKPVSNESFEAKPLITSFDVMKQAPPALSKLRAVFDKRLKGGAMKEEISPR
jgi:hypothetical protein